jgi:uncharacterized protein
MKIRVNQITESPKEKSFEEGTDELNRMYDGERVGDFHFPPAVNAHVLYYRSGQELFFQGSVSGAVEGTCSRCLKDYSLPVEKEFNLVLLPDPLGLKSRELNRDEMGLSYYSTEEIDLAPLIREQVLLALPIRPLCDDQCRGLCASCGAELNQGPCGCAPSEGDPRMGTFRALRQDQKPSAR